MSTRFGAPKLVSSEAELRQALLAGGVIALKDDITISNYIEITVDGTTLMGSNVAISGMARLILNRDDTNSYAIIVNADDVTIENLEITCLQDFYATIEAQSATHRNHSAIGFVRTLSGAKCQRFKLRKCNVHNFWMGVYMSGSIAADFVDDMLIEDNWFHTFSHTAIYAIWSIRNMRIVRNHIEWALDGETHIPHPNYSTMSGSPPHVTSGTAGNCIFVGGGSGDLDNVSSIYIEKNVCERGYRWGIEPYYVSRSHILNNVVRGYPNGISTSGKMNDVNGNTVEEAFGGVGALEIVGTSHTCRANKLLSNGITCVCGIALNADAAGEPPTQAIISDNEIHEYQFGMQIYSNTAKTSVENCLIKGNRIYLNTRPGENAIGIYFNNDAANEHLTRNVVEENFFIGNSLSSGNQGCVHLLNAIKNYVKRNHQIGELQTIGGSPETEDVNAFIWLAGASSVYMDDIDTETTGNGIHDIGTNTRIVP